jgi:hypothetical protein
MNMRVQGTFAMTWLDRLAIERHEITTAAIIIADLLEGRPVSEDDFRKLARAGRRLRALAEHSRGRR